MREPEWKGLASVMVVYGGEGVWEGAEGSGESWTIWTEEEIEEKIKQLKRKVNRRNESREALNARRTTARSLLLAGEQLEE